MGLRAPITIRKCKSARVLILTLIGTPFFDILHSRKVKSVAVCFSRKQGSVDCLL